MSSSVVALDITLPVKQAFHALYREGISMAPLWDSNKCQFVGMLSAMDFILVLKEWENIPTTYGSSEVSSIPIVDNNDSLLDINSRRDIIALVKDKVYARISLSGFSIHQALLLGRDARFSCRLHNGPRCHMCLRSDSLHKERLANPGVRQLVVIEAGSRLVEGIISIGNVFRILLS
ncbi:sucrose nonfermenting 4-like protein [Glycine soja]|uniref:sucrose nonfermenting 4-like protein n=1 Tax=Glycine soja TaxID=3848 RepID=UPI00103C0ACE|nr:sucrose nonfermenting 4-like protein [Glycine soja]